MLLTRVLHVNFYDHYFLYWKIHEKLLSYLFFHERESVVVPTTGFVYALNKLIYNVAWVVVCIIAVYTYDVNMRIKRKKIQKHAYVCIFKFFPFFFLFDLSFSLVTCTQTNSPYQNQNAPTFTYHTRIKTPYMRLSLILFVCLKNSLAYVNEQMTMIYLCVPCIRFRVCVCVCMINQNTKNFFFSKSLVWLQVYWFSKCLAKEL